MWWSLGPKPVKLVKMMEGVNSFYDQLSMAQDVKKGMCFHQNVGWKGQVPGIPLTLIVESGPWAVLEGVYLVQVLVPPVPQWQILLLPHLLLKPHLLPWLFIPLHPMF